MWGLGLFGRGRNPKRVAEEETRPANKKQKQHVERKSYAVTPRQLVNLGGPWEGLPPFAGDEDKLYRWLAEPAMWARLVMNDLEPRVQQRLVQLHAGVHDGIDASGYVCWRMMPALQPKVKMSLKAKGLRGTHIELPRVSIRQHRFAPSSHFDDNWEARSFAGPPASAAAMPAWLRNARRLVQDATFNFLGAPMPVVDDQWASDRFGRQDAVTHALVDIGSSSSSRGGRGGGSGGGGAGSSVAAAIIETPFPAERLLRSLVNAGKDDEVLYIDAIVADRYGAAYRLLTDLVAERRARCPERKLIVVLMSVLSSDVLGRYARWGFSYGGLVTKDESSAPTLVDRIDRLHAELKRFESSMAKPYAPSPCSVVEEGLHH